MPFSQEETNALAKIKIRTFVRICLTTGLISGIILNTRELGVERCLPSRYIGCEDVARLFVLVCGIGQVELPSLTIELLLSVAIPRRALKSLKKRDFGVGFVVVRFFK